MSDSKKVKELKGKVKQVLQSYLDDIENGELFKHGCYLCSVFIDEESRVTWKCRNCRTLALKYLLKNPEGSCTIGELKNINMSRNDYKYLNNSEMRKKFKDNLKQLILATPYFKKRVRRLAATLTHNGNKTKD